MYKSLFPLLIFFSFTYYSCSKNDKSDKKTEKKQKISKSRLQKQEFPFGFFPSDDKKFKSSRVWAFLPYPKSGIKGRWARAELTSCRKGKCSLIQNQIEYTGVPSSVIMPLIRKLPDNLSVKTPLISSGKYGVFYARFLKELPGNKLQVVRLWRSTEKIIEIEVKNAYFPEKTDIRKNKIVPMSPVLYQYGGIWVQGMVVAETSTHKIAVVRRTGGSVDLIDKKGIFSPQWGYDAKTGEKVIAPRSSSSFFKKAEIIKKTKHSMLFTVRFSSGIERINVPFWEIIRYDKVFE